MELKNLTCKCCTAPLDPAKATGRVIRCEYCGTAFVLAREDDGKVVDLLRSGELLLDTCKFDDAYAAYQKAAELDKEEPEAYFGMALAKFKVQYLKDETSDPPRLQPICHEISEKKFTDDKNYQRALGLATREQKKIYLEKAAGIDAIRDQFNELKESGLDYDCFLCAKVSDDNGGTTQDSHEALRLYHHLKERGFCPFYSEEEIGSRTGSDYEALILYALCTSECMLLVCSNEDYLQTKWVKNEYTRFMSMIANEDKERDAITFVFKGKPIERLPGKSGKIQGIDLSRPDAYTRIDSFVETHTPAARARREAEKVRKKQAEEERKQHDEEERKTREEENNRLSEEAERDASLNKLQRKKIFARRMKIAAIVLCCIFFVLGVVSLTVGLIYKGKMDQVREAEEYISYLPDYEIQDYNTYEDIFDAALQSYDCLADWQKEKVENRDRLLSALDGFTTYRIKKLRTYIAEITPETAEESGNIKKALEYYGKFTADQRSVLESEERFALEQYQKVQDIVDLISAIHDDVLNRYGEIADVRKAYLTISPEYQNLVYNYSLVDTFEAQVEFYHSLNFTQVTGGYSVSLAEGKTVSGDVEMPSIYNGQNVVEILGGAFKDCHAMTSIVVPDTVTKIGKEAFSGCNRLESITIPFVGGSLDSNMNLAYIFGTVPQSLKNVTVTLQDRIEDAAFKGCNHIEKVFYRQTIDYIGASCFEGCELLSTFNSETEGTLSLLGEMETIGESAFKGCESIKNIIFSEETLTIGNYAFSGCKNIEVLTLTERIRTIGDYAFQGLKKITSVVVKNSTEIIGAGAFADCLSISEITLPFTGRSKDAQGDQQVFGYIFGYATSQNQYGSLDDFEADSPTFHNQKCGNIEGAIWQYTRVVCPSGLVTTWLTSFYYFIPSGLTKVTITNQTEVRTAAFNGCTMLTDITFTKGIESQGECAFQNCTATIHDGTQEE